MSKHTPGKWRLGTRNGERAIYGPKGEEIAVFTGMLFNDEELANARLIEAAPELLEACKLLEYCIENAAKSKHWSFEIAQALIPARNAAYEALAKAEGRA